MRDKQQEKIEIDREEKKKMFIKKINITSKKDNVEHLSQSISPRKRKESKSKDKNYLYIGKGAKKLKISEEKNLKDMKFIFTYDKDKDIINKIKNNEYFENF